MIYRFEAFPVFGCKEYGRIISTANDGSWQYSGFTAIYSGLRSDSLFEVPKSDSAPLQGVCSTIKAHTTLALMIAVIPIPVADDYLLSEKQ
ncbi:hypothetical protein JTB14_015175 [Gonioctena quinquepunctata]|nr:hypothetical protein JTB14_015175 [Gonioctena quinquepunctata]